jgi:hypothetical protein
VEKALIRFIPAAAAVLAVAAIAALTKIGSVTVPGGAGGEGIAAA